VLRPLSIAVLLATLLPVRGPAKDVTGTPIHVGPVYTRGSEPKNYPKYPDLEILLDLPPLAGNETFSPGDFSLRVDGGGAITASQEQALGATGFGVAASIALDVSGSMKGKPLAAVRTGLRKFVGDATPHDKVAIQTIADEGRWDSDWDSPREQVSTAIDGLATRGNLTRLWDALLEAIQHFPGTPLARHLVVISDGNDEGSAHKEAEVIASALQNGVVIDAIGVTRSNPESLQTLDHLAAQTGGHFHAARDEKELEELVSSGIRRLQATPVVSFRSNDVPADGKVHRFEITWRHNGKDSSAETSASIPSAFSVMKTQLSWAAGVIAFVLLFVVGIFLLRSKRPRAESTYVPSRAQGMPHPRPAVSDWERSTPLPPRPFLRQSAANILSNMEQKAFAPAAGQPSHPAQQPLMPRKAKTQIVARFPAATPGRPAAQLLCESGFAAGKEFMVDAREYWIGALENNQLQITGDATVSANHACLIFEHEVLRLYDHHSTNGTTVNGEVVRGERCLLRPGDRIRIGQSIFLLKLPAQPGGSGNAAQ
jgi:hypothetical protein